jgi:ribosome-associated protein
LNIEHRTSNIERGSEEEDFWDGAGGNAGYGGRPAREIMAIHGEELALACAKAADDIQAEGIRLWDMRGVSTLTDFMIVCSGNSMPHLRAVIRDIAAIVEEQNGNKPSFTEGRADTRWVVLDYVDVMVHVMHQEMRDFYALEELWKDAKEVDWKAKLVA